jgi:DNA-directed RNA polymerase subunit RPC12/RpoP
MGIRFLCEHCQKRLNVKTRQAGEYCVCPDCGNEILIPFESTIEPIRKKRKKKRTGAKKNPVEVELSPVVGVGEAASIELEKSPLHIAKDLVDESVTVVEASIELKSQPANEEASGENSELQIDDTGYKLAPVQKPMATDPDSTNEENETASKMPKEKKIDGGGSASTPTFGDKEQIDSGSLVNEVFELGHEPSEDFADEAESFLLSKPVVKVEDDPLRSNPDLVWYLRHKRLGEKGPLKARQIEAMLESGQIREGYIVWREDWNDWLPAEEVFKELVVNEETEPPYEIPDSLNPHSESSRKLRAQKRFWMCFNAAAFLLVVLLVYWVTQFGW